MQSRTELRRRLRRMRRALSDRQRRLAARALQRHLASSPLFRRSRRVAGYLAADGELDPSLVLEAAWRAGKQVYLPCLGRDQTMRFRLYRGRRDLMRRNRFGIKEPTRSKSIPANKLDLVLTPLVGFDRFGNRLGMGGGFYDRTFAFLHRRQRWAHPHIIGIAYRFQEVAGLAAEPWDVPLWGAATDGGVRRFRRRQDKIRNRS